MIVLFKRLNDLLGVIRINIKILKVCINYIFSLVINSAIIKGYFKGLILLNSIFFTLIYPDYLLIHLPFAYVIYSTLFLLIIYTLYDNLCILSDLFYFLFNCIAFHFKTILIILVL